MQIIGKQFIGGQRTSSGQDQFTAREVSTDTPLPYTFYQADQHDVATAATCAAKAAQPYRQLPLDSRANFLETIAAEIDALSDDFIQLVMQETALPELRIRGERTRTSNQLRLFASVIRKGDFLGARIDTALPERQPLPRPDIRQYKIPLGPVAVFGACNFPLAFSVAGGDTASALAAGCPVTVKAHPSHPATSEIVAGAICTAVEKCGMPASVFGMLFGMEEAGELLVDAPDIKAVGFTGSVRGGRAICTIAAARPEPIPVFAEMSSVNPVIILPGALAARNEQIAADLAASITLGAGQFCTNPGLIFGIKSQFFTDFKNQLLTIIKNHEHSIMLNKQVLDNYHTGLQRLTEHPGIEVLCAPATANQQAASALFKISAEHFLVAKHLHEEIFGPSSLIVEFESLQQLKELLPTLDGQLTASLQADPTDFEKCQDLIAQLENRVGRLILNGYPTGVEVCDAMVHGGPFPATSDARSSSVGSTAIDRFLRPVSYQGYPDELLPDALKNANPLNIRRLINGEWSAGQVQA